MFALQSTTGFLGTELLQDMLKDFARTIPNLLIALLIIIIGWFIAKIIAAAVKKVLKAIKADALGEKLEEIEFVNQTGINISISGFASKLVYYIVFFMFLVVAVEKLGVDAITQMMTDMIAFIPNLILAMAILIFGILFAELLRKVLTTSLKSLGIPSANIIGKAIFYFLLINVFIVAMSQSGINTDFLSSNITVLIGGVAAAFAISYGLASKTLASNTISSFYAKDDVEIGQTISISGSKGKVIAIGNRNITLETTDGTTIIPFSQLMEETIVIHK